MSCRQCEDFNVRTYPFRWHEANIEITACPRHAKEVMEALKQAQFNEIISDEKRLKNI
jgi:hypothetical protein